MNIGRLLERNAQKHHNKTAVVFETTRLTYADLNGRIDQLAHALLAEGVRPQQKVAIVCHNSNQYVEIIFACAKLNVIPVHFNWRLSAKEIHYLLEQDQISLIFFSARYEDTYLALRPVLGRQVKVVSVGGLLEAALEYEALLRLYPQMPLVNLPDEADEDVAMQFFTSGTTGHPKGVLHTHRGIISQSLMTIADAGWTRDTVYLFATPMFHTAATGTITTLIYGATLVLMAAFEMEEYLSIIDREKVTRILAVPNMLRRMLDYPALDNHDLGSLQIISYAGAPMPNSVMDRALARFNCGFVQTYGMTEMAPVLCVLGTQDHVIAKNACDHSQLYSVGRPVMGVDLKIVDEDCAPCPEGVIGEIVVRSYSAMRGYTGSPEATSGGFRGQWYHTGDIGYIDRNGFVFRVDRKDDMIVSGGENIYPLEVENCINMLTEDVVDVAVIGIPDEYWGQVVKAIIVRKPDSKITAEDIISHCKQNIASYKKPSVVEFTQALPRNANGKIQKNLLRQAADIKLSMKK